MKRPAPATPRAPRLIIASLLLAGSACAHRGTAADAGTRPPTEPEVRVYVNNHYASSLEVFASGSGINHRLGLVAPGIQRSFILPQVLIRSGGQVEFLAQPSGGGSIVRSGVVTIAPGDVVDFEIEANLIGSRAVVRN
jgi:hypothetical protein